MIIKVLYWKESKYLDCMITTENIVDMRYFLFKIFEDNKLTPFTETKRQQVTICILENIWRYNPHKSKPFSKRCKLDLKETTGWQYHLLASEKLSEAGTFLQSEIGKTYKYSMRCTKLDYCLPLFQKLPKHQIFCFWPCIRMHQLLKYFYFCFIRIGNIIRL